MLGDFQQALQDASNGVSCGFTHGRIHERCVKCMLLLCRFETAEQFIKLRVQYMSVEEFQRPSLEWQGFLDMGNRVMHHMDVISQIEALLNDPQDDPCVMARSCIEMLREMQLLLSQVEARSPWGLRVRVNKVCALLLPRPGEADALLLKAWVREALDEAEELVVDMPHDPRPLYWRARCLFLAGHGEAKGRASLAEAEAKPGGHADSAALRESLDLISKEKEAGNAAFLRRDFKVALAHLNRAIDADKLRLDPELSAVLLCNRSAVLHKLGESSHLVDALRDVTHALSLKPTYAKALLRRGLIYMDQERYQSAALAFDEALQLGQLVPADAPGARSWRARAQRWAKKPPPRNWYALLRVPFDASEEDVRRAYKKAALKWHPDKNPDNYQKAERVFKEIQQAFQVLSDPKQRSAFDGCDDEAGHGKMKASHMPFFGANFGSAAGYTQAQVFLPGGGVPQGTQEAQFGPLAQMRSCSFSDNPGKGGASGRFSGWSYQPQGKGAAVAHPGQTVSSFASKVQGKA